MRTYYPALPGTFSIPVSSSHLFSFYPGSTRDYASLNCRFNEFRFHTLGPSFHITDRVVLGSTLISAILEHNRHLTVVNVGDSRAVACDLEGRARPLSIDHKPSDVSDLRQQKASLTSKSSRLLA